LEVKSFENEKNIFNKKVFEYVELILNKLEVELILFGSGKKVESIPENIQEYLIKNNKNYEVMNSMSAYNTHNILLSEKRSFISILKLL
jgi:uncharacterized protein